eukprot:scaffold5725_cov387-Prasinococcus_capsulatus_cf.AAC.7
MPVVRLSSLQQPQTIEEYVTGTSQAAAGQQSKKSSWPGLAHERNIAMVQVRPHSSIHTPAEHRTVASTNTPV